MKYYDLYNIMASFFDYAQNEAFKGSRIVSFIIISSTNHRYPLLSFSKTNIPENPSK